MIKIVPKICQNIQNMYKKFWDIRENAVFVKKGMYEK